ncbi:GatB/YqeY domain-containing protein [uncultured Jannaschia sp.]|uniref:GatB/YqeY domain-containing protein n=1 Tax=uncultured Jannaschia sp. TaxID=293347 RepID=UPI00263823B5|nr:GatB/YqeY domain-containing protein [uncultured Jannaschia sp.]
MELRDRLASGLKAAMRDKDSRRVGTLRLINAALKDQDIALRAEGRTVGDAEALAILAKMVKQRQESARAYEEAGRLELAEQERSEIAIVEEFLPRKLSDSEVEAALDAAITETGAASLRDMGRVMGILKDRHQGQIDFAAVGPMVKARLV